MTEEVSYNGRMISKEGFRAFVYGFEGKTKLVESWDEFDAHIHSDEWFEREQDVPLKKVRKKME